MISITYKDPWTMMYSEYADEFIEIIRESLPKEHPLHGRDFYPSGKISREYVFLIEDDSTGQSGLLDLRKTMKRKGKRMPYYKEFKEPCKIQEMIDRDHHEWLSQLGDGDHV